jgi:hypothetical protein
MRFLWLLIFLYTCHQVSYAQAWELKKDSDSIEVFTRSVSKSPVKEYKAVAEVAASAEEILAVLRDVPAYTQWIEDVVYTKTISSAENKMSFYYQMSLPWPAKDRDLCLDMEITRLNETITVSLTSNPDLLPVDEDFIRIITIEGQWVITAIDESNSLVEQQFLADPEGSLPKWIVNMFVVDSPYQTMKNMRDYLVAN